MPYRVGNRNARNIYKYSFGRDEDVHVGVMFTPEDGRAAVEALNLWQDTMSKGTPTPVPVRQYMVRAYTASQNGSVASEHAQPYQTYQVFASDEDEAARVFQARNPLAVIRDLWQLIPAGYLGPTVFTGGLDARDLCATPVTANAGTVDEEEAW